jgi:hypothetical protein
MTVAKRRRFDPICLVAAASDPRVRVNGAVVCFLFHSADRFRIFPRIFGRFFQGCDGIFQIKSTRLRHGQNRYLRCARSNQSVPSNKSEPDGEPRFLFYFILLGMFLAIVETDVIQLP